MKKNAFLMDLDQPKIKDFLTLKNLQGNSPLDLSVIQKASDTYNILNKFAGEDLEVSVKIANYKLAIKSNDPVRKHSQKGGLLTISEKNPTINNFKISDEELNYLKQTEKFETPKPLDHHLKIHEILLKKPVKIVDTIETLKLAIEDINKSSIIGIDLEYFLEDHPVKIGFVCLIQISTIQQDYIIDTIKLHDEIEKYLSEVFLSEKILKCFHGCDSDLKWLKSDFNIDVVNLFDSAKAMMILTNEKISHSLTNLCAKYLGFSLDKSYQQADWRVRPLTQGMLAYARLDSSVLLFLWKALLNQMTMDQVLLLQRKMIKKSWRCLEKSSLPSVSVIPL